MMFILFLKNLTDMTSFRVGGISVRFLIICLFLDVTRHLEHHLGHNQCTINIDGKKQKLEGREGRSGSPPKPLIVQSGLGNAITIAAPIEQPP